jgi:hypothetical protein
MNANLKLRVVCCLIALVIAPPIAFGVLIMTKVASQGKPVTPVDTWPNGVEDLVNDEVRIDGWNDWFSGSLCSVSRYAFDVHHREDVDRLIRKLAAIEAEEVQLSLIPEDGTRRTLSSDEDAGSAEKVGVVFTDVKLVRVDRGAKPSWGVKPGVRSLDISGDEKKPRLHSLTLILYLGHKAVDLESLKIPSNIHICTATGEAYRAKHKDAFEKIDAFIEQHQARQKQSAEAP